MTKRLNSASTSCWRVGRSRDEARHVGCLRVVGRHRAASTEAGGAGARPESAARASPCRRPALHTRDSEAVCEMARAVRVGGTEAWFKARPRARPRGNPVLEPKSVRALAGGRGDEAAAIITAAVAGEPGFHRLPRETFPPPAI